MRGIGAAVSIAVLLALAPDHSRAADKPTPEEILARAPEAGALIAGVPHVPQDRYQCGPSALSSVLRFHGVDADPDAIEERFATEAVVGTFTVDLLIAASDAGMEAHWIEADLAGLKAEIDDGRPAVVFLNLLPNPLPKRHFAVAVGYLEHGGSDYVILHSGNDAWLMVGERKFKRQWSRTGNMMMTVEPKKDTGPAAGEDDQK